MPVDFLTGEQQRLIPATLRRVRIRSREQGVHFLLLQVETDEMQGNPLEMTARPHNG
jgi:hypothetical protein